MLLPPLIDGVRSLEKRSVSGPWVGGTLLVGVAGTALLSGSLYTAWDVRAALREPTRVVAARQHVAPARKGDRPLVALAPAPPRERILRVPTRTRLGASYVIRKKPFALASAPLGIAAPASYAPFDALAIFSAPQTDVTAAMESLYGADVESPVTTRRSPFPVDASFEDRPISAPAAALAAAKAREALDRGAAHVAALPYLTPTAERPVSSRSDPFAIFDDTAPAAGDAAALAKTALPLATALTLEAENVSRVERMGVEPTPASRWAEPDAPMAREAVLTIDAQQDLLPELHAALVAYGTDKALAAALGRAALDGLAGAKQATLRVAYHARAPEVGPGMLRSVRRISVYRGRSHVASLARRDDGRIIAAPEPVPVRAAFEWDREERARLAASMPTVYDGLMRAALSQGLTEAQGRKVVRLMAADLDFRAKVGPDDHLEVFYEVAEGNDAKGGDTEGGDANGTSRVLYAAATVGGTTHKFYRLVSSDGKVAFFDEGGRSPSRFLLRKPVPDGRFTSGYGMRRHPKLRYRKMHSGVDWAARSGTPILAAGRGLVVKAGWAGGYGRQVKIRHANGYVTSYNHLRRFARKIRAGATVEQGQIIGQVGSSGLSTGPHLHYEVIVNGRKVNPMRIRVPRATTLSGARLTAFERERDRIDALVARARGGARNVASAR